MEKKDLCPACGAALEHRSRFAIFSVCPYCQSTLTRQGEALSILGKQAEVPEDMSPLQIGSLGQAGKDKFTVAGKIRMVWSHGFWNEYFLSFQNGRSAWLGEAEGMYYLTFSLPLQKPPSRGKLIAGQSLAVADYGEFTVADAKEATCLGVLGELPYIGLQGSQKFSVDLIGGQNQFATLEFRDKEVEFYLGSSFEFPELKFENLRKLEGWSATSWRDAP